MNKTVSPAIEALAGRTEDYFEGVVLSPAASLLPYVNPDLIASTTAIVIACINASASGGTGLTIDNLPVLIDKIHDKLASLGRSVDKPEAMPEPACSIRRSVQPDYIVCLEDGKKLKMLKRHLMTRYKMTPEQYRARWNLPADYPMVAPNYAEKRRELAVNIGLGRKPGARKPRKAKA